MANVFVAFWHDESNKMIVGNLSLSSDGSEIVSEINVLSEFVWNKNTSSRLKEFNLKAIICLTRDSVNLDLLKQLKEIHPKALLIGLVGQNYSFNHKTNLFKQFDCLLPSAILPNQLTRTISFIMKGNLCIPRFWLKSAQKALLEEQALKKPAQESTQESTNDKDSFSLTFREAEVFQLVSKGYSNNEIAQELFLSLATVKSHISSIFRKFSFTKRTQTVIYQHQKRSSF